MALLSLVSLVGCAPSQSDSLQGVAFENAEPLSVEYSTSQQEVRKAIESTSLEFAVPSQAQEEVWGRVGILFREFLGINSVHRIENPSTGGITLSGVTTSSVRYEIKRAPSVTVGGFRYTVSCSASDPESARLSAKNVARFLQSGNLEMEFLLR